MRSFERIRIKNENPNLEILELKAAFLLELDADILKPENAEIVGDIDAERDNLIYTELALLAKESIFYWTATEEPC